MPSWRCPHCSTPQAEASRCWVCHRSSTSCGTCRNFRGSVAGRLGFCGLDRKREPLRGDEVRACWEDGALPIAPDPAMPGLLDLLTTARLHEAPAATAVPGGRDQGGRREDGPVPGGERPSRRLWVEVEA
jgi:hypothetical protein